MNNITKNILSAFLQTSSPEQIAAVIQLVAAPQKAERIQAVRKVQREIEVGKWYDKRELAKVWGVCEATAMKHARKMGMKESERLSGKRGRPAVVWSKG